MLFFSFQEEMHPNDWSLDKLKGQESETTRGEQEGGKESDTATDDLAFLIRTWKFGADN